MLEKSDDDGNKVELSALNFSSREEVRRFMATDEFRSNPNGFLLDPERLAVAAQAGGNLSELIWER